MGGVAKTASKVTDVTPIGLISKTAAEKSTKEKEKKKRATMAAEAAKREEELQTENRRLNKELSISQRSNRASGISSLLGEGSDTLG